MKNRVVVGLITAGFILILASVFFPNRGFDFFSSNSIAKITEITSESTNGVLTHGLDQYDEIPAKQGLNLRHLDIIKTSALSEAVILFAKNDGEIRLQENSEVLIEQLEDKSILVTVRMGDILIESFGKGSAFWIRKDGRQMTAMDYALSNEKNSEILRQKGQKITVDNNVLQQAKIEEILNSKKSDFFRCYGQLIQKTEQAHGQVLISFEISTFGKVTKVEINRSDIDDQSFKSCLSEVVSRTQFPKFSGQPITTVFPLKFD